MNVRVGNIGTEAECNKCGGIGTIMGKALGGGTFVQENRMKERVFERETGGAKDK